MFKKLPALMVALKGGPAAQVLLKLLNYEFNNSYDTWTLTRENEYGSYETTPDGFRQNSIYDGRAVRGRLHKDDFSFLVEAGTHILFNIEAMKKGNPSWVPGGWGATIRYSDSSTSELGFYRCMDWLPGGTNEWNALPEWTTVHHDINLAIPSAKIGLTIASISIFMESYASSTNYNLTIANVLIETP